MAHAELAPSAAARWMNCPGSVRLSRGIPPEPPGPYATEGTAVHAVGELAMQRFTAAENLVGETVMGLVVTADMAATAEVYIAQVRARTPKQGWLKLEQKVSLGAWDLDQIHGTADALIYDAEARKLTVLDLKSGAGVFVSAGTPQLAIYALGALGSLAEGEVCDSVECVVVQPRNVDSDDDKPGVRSHCWTVESLSIFATQLFDAALATTLDDAPVVAGAWCRFCPVRRTCPALRQHALETTQNAFATTPLNDVVPVPAVDLTNEDLGKILHRAELVELWLRGVREEASQRLDTGQAIPGWKLVPKRATRKWIDEKEAAAALREVGLSEDQLFVTELRSPAQIEKVLGKSQRARVKDAFGTIVHAVSSGSTLAREDDERPAVAAPTTLLAQNPLPAW